MKRLDNAWLASLCVLLGFAAAPPEPSPPTKSEAAPLPPSRSGRTPVAAESKADLAQDKAEADRLLRSKGLRRVGPVYVLEREDDLQRLALGLGNLTREWELVVGQMRQRDEVFQRTQELFNAVNQRRLNTILANQLNPVTIPAKTGNASDAAAAAAAQAELANRAILMASLENQLNQYNSTLTQARFDFQALAASAATREAEYQRGEAELSGVAAELRNRYKELGGDTEVKAALAILNTDSARRYALGPREDYAANVRATAATLLQSKGFQPERKGAGVVLGADVDLQTAAYQADSCRLELAQVLRKRDAWKHAADFRHKTMAELAEQEQRLATVGEKDRTKAAELQTTRGRLARLHQQDAEAEKTKKEITAEVTAKREHFVFSIDCLRKAVEVSHVKHEEVDPSVEVKRALADLKSKRAGKKQPTYESLLEDVEGTIRTEKVSLIPDRTARLLSVAVNGLPERPMVIDPNVEVVRVSERFASAVGIRPDANAPLVTFATPDGRPLEARRAIIANLRIGPFSVENVEALIVLGDYDAPPVLGASVLDHFLVQPDAEAGTITLTRFDVKAVAPRLTGRNGSVAPAKTKEREKTKPAVRGGP